MTDAEQREAARQFINRWQGKGNEDEDGRSYWIELLHDVLGMEDVTQHVNFEKKVYVDGNKKRIDAYLPETKVIIEQKSLGKALDQKIHNSGDIDLTPYEQAKRYSDNLDFSERARWIVTCNFAEIWIYDMNQVNTKDFEPTKIRLPELQDKYPMLDFLIKQDVKQVSPEMKVSIEAGNIVGKLYDAFAKEFGLPEGTPKKETPEEKAQREADLRSLNALCVRLVFCLYAEDAGIFDRASFHDYVASFEPQRLRGALKELFKILDTPIVERDRFLADDLAAFPYVNGGLFADESLEIPPFTEELKHVLLIDASENFDWRGISPTIFGAVFESTLNPETRRKGGMHYTSIENIHKVIDPLFLDDLKSEFAEIKAEQVWKTKKRQLEAFQRKLASLKWLDPACGSGNFLTETYLSVRRIENEVISELQHGQIMYALEGMRNPIQVSISQFYGIEINDFAVTVAKTALWIAESQMMQETISIIKMDLDFLPLTTNANIVEGNALRIDWNDVVPASELNYIMGNPPFVGYAYQSQEQKNDLKNIKAITKKSIDYVAGWYYKTAEYFNHTNIRAAFVSTNSICQGEQVVNVWQILFEHYQVHIDFAYRTFRWDSEANEKAHVHVVIVGFSQTANEKRKRIFDNDNVKEVDNISAYLVGSDNVFISRRTKPLSNVPAMTRGSQPTDNGNLILTEEEKNELIKAEPQAGVWIRPFMMGKDFINRKPRYCLWLVDADPKVLRKCPLVLKRIEAVKTFRLNSKKAATRKKAETPQLFDEIKAVNTNYVAIPVVSSERRRYIPIDLLSSKIIAGNKLFMMPNATPYEFGILTSNVHMAWMRTVCGRLKSDYSYSNTIVYNNFPWPTPTDKQKALIEKTAQGILDARDLYPDSSLADLYDPLTMPPELRKAHQMNDRAVMQAYGFSTKMSESDCVAELMKMYQRLTEK
ncbi:DNA methyltransferase [Pseudoramibacter sp.]|jgi:type I restriction-modification system DNA methylase subunit|uniref:DNA methyltransferase n=1 Tax=Pseudoramibacter sp. TaxID=2034862 RepID=UPI0025E9AA62|nr:DNA methyltransferase [Pseudoramibacter sp.]MCH4072063.1 N-6 DNA methylase [Pseudoramibacter sp.]MCH4105832.1 N-6 DNA methylase [Pseudoramibacter sp.]